MARANEIKRGYAVSLNGKLLLVKDIDIQTPSARGASTLYKVRFTDIKTGRKVEERFKGDDNLETIHLTHRAVSFTTSGTPGLQVLVMNNQAIALELPQTVDMVIVETAPSLKGASANARTKPAMMATGLIIQVPEYLSIGEKIRIHIAERRYMGRCD